MQRDASRRQPICGILCREVRYSIGTFLSRGLDCRVRKKQSSPGAAMCAPGSFASFRCCGMVGPLSGTADIGSPVGLGGSVAIDPWPSAASLKIVSALLPSSVIVGVAHLFPIIGPTVWSSPPRLGQKICRRPRRHPDEPLRDYLGLQSSDAKSNLRDRRWGIWDVSVQSSGEIGSAQVSVSPQRSEVTMSRYRCNFDRIQTFLKQPRDSFVP